MADTPTPQPTAFQNALRFTNTQALGINPGSADMNTDQQNNFMASINAGRMTGASEPSVVSTENGQRVLQPHIDNQNADMSSIQDKQNQNTQTTSNPPTGSDATIAALKQMGGVTADEAKAAGIDVAGGDYNYDVTSGLFLPSQGMASKTNFDKSVANANDVFTSWTGKMDAATQQIIQSLQADYGSRVLAEEDINRREEAGLNTSMIRQGTSRYANEVYGGIMTAEENAGLAKIEAINNELATKISDAQNTLTDKEYTAFINNRNEIDKLNTERDTALKDLQTQNIQAIKDQQTRLQKIQDDISGVALEAAKNGADPATLAKIKSATNYNDAISAAGGSLQTATGQLGDYLQYKRDATANGQTPENYATWKAADDANTARTKASEAYATAFATARGKAAGEAGANGNVSTSPVTSSVGVTKGMVFNAPASIAPYVSFSANGVKYVDLSNFAGTPTEKNQAVQDAQNAGYKVITNKNTALDVQNISDAMNKLSDMKSAFDANNTGNAAERDSYSAAFMVMAKKLQTDPNAVGTDIYQDTALDILKAMSGVQGFRGGQSIVEQVKSTFPQNTDTQAVVDAKISNLQKLIGDRETVLVGTPSASDQLLIDANNAQTSLTDFVTNTPTITINGVATSTAAVVSNALYQPGATPSSVYKAMKDRGLIQ